MLLKNKIFNIFFFLIILSQITPALIGQQYEYLILFFAFCFSFFIFHDDEKLFFNYLILFLLILLSFKLFKQLRFIEFGLLINKNMLADLRFFFVIFISFFVVKNSKLNLDQLLVLIFFLQLYLTFPNILGLIDPFLYQKFHSFYYDGAYEIGSYKILYNKSATVSSHASTVGRFSSIFLMPASAGIFYTLMLFTLFLIYRLKKQISLLFLMTVFLVIFNGFLPRSTIFFSFPLIFVFYFFLKLNVRIKIYFSLILIFLTLMFYLIIGEDFFNKFIHDYMLSGRYKENSNFDNFFSKIELSHIDYFFGILPQYFGYPNFGPKGAMDSGLVIKFVSGGYIYIFIYYLIIYSIFRSIYKIFLFESDYKYYFDSLFLFCLLCSSGITPLSQPQVTMISFLIIFAVLKVYKEKKDQTYD